MPVTSREFVEILSDRNLFYVHSVFSYCTHGLPRSFTSQRNAGVALWCGECCLVLMCGSRILQLASVVFLPTQHEFMLRLHPGSMHWKFVSFGYFQCIDPGCKRKLKLGQLLMISTWNSCTISWNLCSPWSVVWFRKASVILNMVWMIKCLVLAISRV